MLPCWLLGALTRTPTVALPLFTVISAGPAPMAVTIPWLFTVARDRARTGTVVEFRQARDTSLKRLAEPDPIALEVQHAELAETPRLAYRLALQVRALRPQLRV